MPSVITGVERLTQEAKIQGAIKGNIGLLCHSASIDRQYVLTVFHLQRIFKDRFKKIFGPQHGFVTDVQDNMVESKDYIHPYFKLPVHSLYSHTRVPTDAMLEGLNTIVVDLQDVGTRVYTYIHTLTLLMEKCAEKNIKVVVLDRPNPIGGEHIEGNILEHGLESFVGRQPIPQRHALTIGEVALIASKYFGSACELEVVPMLNWKREMYFHETGLPYALPSPNLPTPEGNLVYAGTVLFEGTNISEGRGTTRALEIIGHPKIEPFGFLEKIQSALKEWEFHDVVLRPLVFMPTFHKFQGQTCGGFQIHPTNFKTFKSWRLSQLLCHLLYKELGKEFEWAKKPYEYEFDRLAIDLINGTSKVRLWCENDGSLSSLVKIEKEKMDDYMSKRDNILIYR